ncbi:MAG: aminopeptidase family protein P [Acetobacteraceae bacterium]|nr:aminopeptidase family protein P [Acetobacteraceae bacterium]
MTPPPLTALRTELANQGLDGFIVPRADEHLGEYVPAAAERLAWLTGFTGSAGMAAVLAEHAAVFTDGRYVLQLAAQTDGALWERLHITETPPPGWLAQHAPPAARIGYDPLLISEEALGRYTEAGLTMQPVTRNPIDAVWTDRPLPPAEPAEPQPLGYAGRSADNKRADIAKLLRDAKQDAAVLSDPASIAWLLNIRGGDVPFTPFALGFALVHADGGTDLFMDPAKLPPTTRAWLGNSVSVAGRDALAPALGRLAGKRVRVDPAGSPVWFAQRLRDAGATVVAGPDPCLLPKACKNPVEQQGTRNAHARDAVAMCRFLHWLAETGPGGRETEISAAAKLLALRAQVPLFRGESFPAISGAGEHGAIIHYRVSPETDRPIRPDELYLIDSGAQYTDGTTDITRTVWTGPGTPPDAVRARVTRVLKGHIALATLVFPQGIGGAHVDAFARRALWQVGLDYDHGTGHGVGSYLSVHEGPVSISRLARPVAIAAGMILSNEPGYYLPGQYGIRLENLLMVQPADLPDATKPFLRFETITLAPFDRWVIDPTLLDPPERAWLDAYHARVLAEVGPQLGGAAAAWLRAACAPLG